MVCILYLLCRCIEFDPIIRQSFILLKSKYEKANVLLKLHLKVRKIDKVLRSHDN